jgi:hypothetical protein
LSLCSQLRIYSSTCGSCSCMLKLVVFERRLGLSHDAYLGCKMVIIDVLHSFRIGFSLFQRVVSNLSSGAKGVGFRCVLYAVCTHISRMHVVMLLLSYMFGVCLPLDVCVYACVYPCGWYMIGPAACCLGVPLPLSLFCRGVSVFSC